MTNHSDNENGEEKEESFAALLEAYSPGEDADIGVGDKIRGKIVAIGRESVFVDTGTKTDGVVDKAELLDENGELTLAEGDMLELFVVAFSDEEIKLSRALSGIGGLSMLKEAYEKAAPVEGKISETCKGGVRVEVLQRQAFCPVSQIDIDFVENPSDYVGQRFNFLITTFEEKGRNIVLSRRPTSGPRTGSGPQRILSNLERWRHHGRHRYQNNALWRLRAAVVRGGRDGARFGNELV